MKRKTKQKIGQALLILAFHISGIAWLVTGVMTATTLR